jgi:hypothetical protein
MECNEAFFPFPIRAIRAPYRHAAGHFLDILLFANVISLQTWVYNFWTEK